MGNLQHEEEDCLKLTTSKGKYYDFERVYSFVYLGVVIDDKEHEQTELKARITYNKKYGILSVLMKSK